MVVVADGKIAAVGKRGEVDVPADAESVDCKDKRIYPGLFDACDQLGLVEIGAVRATVDDTETGGLNPNAQARVSVNPDSEVIPTVRANGILLAHVTPTGGLVSGEGAVMMLDGWTYEDMTLRPVTGVRLNWPNLLPRESFRQFIPVERQLQQRDENLRRIEEVFDAAERYRLALDAAGVASAATRPATASAASRPAMEVPDYDAKLEAMVPLLTGEIPLIVDANETSQIESAVAFAARRKLKLIVLGAADAGKVIPLLKQHDVAVILEGTHRLPTARDEPYDEPFTLPRPPRRRRRAVRRRQQPRAGLRPQPARAGRHGRRLRFGRGRRAQVHDALAGANPRRRRPRGQLGGGQGCDADRLRRRHPGDADARRRRLHPRPVGRLVEQANEALRKIQTAIRAEVRRLKHLHFPVASFG